jgi:hypothetical protein
VRSELQFGPNMSEHLAAGGEPSVKEGCRRTGWMMLAQVGSDDRISSILSSFKKLKVSFCELRAVYESLPPPHQLLNG